MPPEPADSTSRWHGPLGQKTPERRQLAGFVDVHPQEPGVIHRVLAPLRPRARGDAHEGLLARSSVEPPIGVLAGDDPLGVVEQTLEPLAPSWRRHHREGNGTRASAGRCRPSLRVAACLG